MSKYILLLSFISLLFSCKQSPIADYQEVDLLKYGFPISIKAPIDHEIGKDDLGVIQGIWLKAEGYYVQMYASNTTTLDLGKVKSAKLEEVKMSPYFSKIIQEDENGFVFEKDIDGDIRQDFRYIKIQGDKEYVFQRGLIGNYTDEEVRNMYLAVQ